MYILVTLNPNQGINLGPNFTLTANVGTLVPATATLTQLLAGVSVLAADTATQVTVTSQGVCTNPLVLNVTQPTTTSTTSTSTTTTTTTASPTGTLTLYYTTFTTSFTLQASPATPSTITVDAFISVTGFQLNSCVSSVASAGLTGNILQLNAGGTVISAQRTQTTGTWAMGSPYRFDNAAVSLNIGGTIASYASGQTILIGGILYTFTLSTTCV